MATIFELALSYKDKMLHNLVTSDQMTRDQAIRVGTEFLTAENSFNELVINRARSVGLQQVTSDVVIDCLKEAINQIYDRIYISNNNFITNVSQYGYGNNIPSYGNNIQVVNTQISTDALTGGGSTAFKIRPTVVNPQNTVTSDRQRVINNNTSEDNVPPSNIGVRMNIIDERTAQIFDHKQKLKITGETLKKMEKNFFQVERKAIGINIDGSDDVVKFDIIKFPEDFLIFDNDADAIMFLNTQMSKSDIDSLYFRIINYHRLESINITYEDFFSNYRPLVRYSKEIIQQLNLNMDIKRNNCFNNLKIFNEIIEHLHKSYSHSFVTALEKFLCNYVNKTFNKLFRISSNLKFGIVISELNNLNDVVESSDLAEIRKSNKFEIIYNNILINLISFFQDNNQMKVIDIENNEKGLDHYVRTKQFIEVEPTINALSMDYYKYYENPIVQNNILNSIKDKVLISVPDVGAITNIHSPAFIRQSMITMNKKSLIIPVMNGEQTESIDNLIYLILNNIILKDINNPIPNKFFFYTNKEEYRTFQMKYTLDDRIILE